MLTSVFVGLLLAAALTESAPSCNQVGDVYKDNNVLVSTVNKLILFKIYARFIKKHKLF